MKLCVLSVYLVASCLISGQAAIAGDKPILYMVPQVHTPEEHGAPITDDVIESQLKIGEFFFSKSSKVAVFHESTFKDLEGVDPKQLEKVIETTKNDPEIPQWLKDYYELCLNLSRLGKVKLSDLSGEEKRLIAKVGAVSVLRITNRLTKIHKVAESEEIGDERMLRVMKLLKEYTAQGKKMELNDQDPLYKEMNTDREIPALEEVQRFFKENPNVKEAYIVFGAGHDFRRHQSKFSDFEIKVHPDFQNDTHFWEDLANQDKLH